MKITTLNLQGFVNWDARCQEIVSYLKTEDSDVVFFQEVVYLSDRTPFNQAQLVNQQLDYSYENSAVTRLQPSKEYAVFREGLAAISKYPIIKSDTIVLKQATGDEHNRIVQLLDIEIEGKIVKFANVHFSLTDVEDFATAHLQETLEILMARGEARIILGDFNMTNLDELEALWGEYYRTSTCMPYITFPKQNKRIDYFLIPKAFEFDTITTSGDALSDHRAITTVLVDSLEYRPSLKVVTREEVAA